MSSIRQHDNVVPLAEAVTDLLERSDMLDTQLSLRLAAFREGWAARGAADGDAYERGFAAGVMSVKRAQHDAARLVEFEAKRWAVRGEKRSRTGFGRAHKDDYQGLGGAE
jgi:hypothetical protein